MQLQREKLAWAAGFFDGEGTVSTSCVRYGRGTYPSLRVSVSQKGSLLLERFRAAIGGLGAIYEQKNRPGMFLWQVGNFEHAQAVVAMLWLFLGEPKRTQARRALSVMADFRIRRKST